MRIRFAAFLLVLAGCSPRHDLPFMGQVPQFEMISQDGKPFHSESLAGHVWIADFIFTHCPGPCLRMSTHLHKVQTATSDHPEIRLVSFTVDPARDSPPVLADFAARYQADPKRWVFLTGQQATLQMLSRDTFKLGDVDGSMNHSTRFVLVDKRGRVRGIYGTQDDDDPVAKVTADALQLQKDNS
jgi:protein SCO1/2